MSTTSFNIDGKTDLHRQYIWELQHLHNDYLAKLLIETPIFVQETTPRLPFAYTYDDTHPHMHIHTRNLLVFLHKLGIRP